MRMRTKKWAKPELAVCPFYIKDPTLLKGNWQANFKNRQPIWLELGCGKGGFISQISVLHPEINFIGIDLSSDMLGISKRKVEQSYALKKSPIDNVLLTWQNIERITNVFSSFSSTDIQNPDVVDRIFINFCNPWFKTGQYKKRLTHPRQLTNYKTFLKDNGEIWFKTDDDELFNHSLTYFAENDFSIKYQTFDLHNEYKNQFGESYQTEHEKMYSEEGIKIKFLIAVKN